MVNPEGTENGDKPAALGQGHLAVSHYSHPLRVCPEEAQNEETWDTDPRELRCTLKEWFKWAQHLCIHRKILNSLTWDIWFYFINSNILTFWIPGLLLQKLLYTLAPHLASSEQFLSITWDAVSEYSPNSQLLFRLCFFFQLTNILPSILHNNIKTLYGIS